MVRENKFIKRIDSISYTVFSPKDYEKMSVAKVITPELYDKYGFPVEGGLMDLRMGVLEPGLKCKTCGESYKRCEGHFGHIELARPVFNILFIDVIDRILKLTCKDCFRILLSDEQIKEKVEYLTRIKNTSTTEHFYAIYRAFVNELKKAKVCPHCQSKQEKIKLEKSSVFEFKEGENKRLLATEVRYRFENVREEDLFLLGLEENIRPEWLVLTIMPIPPVSMRSTITLQSGLRSEDDLTHKLTDVIRTNQKLQEHLLVGVPEAIIETVWDLLQYHVSTLYNNKIAGLPPARHKNGDTLKSIVERIEGKKGIIRNNLIGKRVNYSARTVISPDPRLKFNEIGVPIEVAKTLTIRERVNENNIDFLKTLVQNGPDKYPGANYVYTPDNKKKIVTETTKENIYEELDIGYEIVRHMIDGDPVIFNRQPSLHKLSMMGHLARILPIKTFAINPGVCNPYNADFDGDEMNLHMPQSLEGREEIANLLNVKKHLISPASGEAVIGCIHDSISGVYVLTNGLKLTKEDAYELLFAIGFLDVEKIDFKDEVVDGKEVFSVIMPDDLNFVGKNKSGEDVVFKQGVLESGCVDKKLIGDGGGTLLRYLHKQYGADGLLDIVKYIFNLGIQVFKKVGLTVSMRDFDLPADAEKKNQKVYEKGYKEFEELENSHRNNTMEKIPGLSSEESFEIKAMQLLNGLRNDSIEIIKNGIDNNTGLMTMSNSGAKGNFLAISQMHTGVGQQALRGKRISRGFYDRTLSFFKPGDVGPDARGFVKNSLKAGLNPYEFFFACITGRDGLMDTALRTPKSGYLYRRMSTAMLDLVVRKDLSVRDETGKIVQFCYGDDAIDVSKTVAGDIDTKSIIDNTLRGLNKNE